MVAALVEEIRIRNSYLENDLIETIYFGGGTPSLLHSNELEHLLQSIFQFFTVAENAEITLEANPDDISPARLQHWRSAGINRLSIGIQSLFDEDLLWMNRVHSAKEASKVIEMARAASFEHFSVDLIYGMPTLTDERWLQNLEWVVQQGVNHLSCYALTVEPRTALDAKIKKQLLQDVDPAHQKAQFMMLLDFAAANEWEHYEISNFAKQGHRSRHNTSYWSGIPYLGIGPGAHSFNGVSRQWNISNNMQYIRSLQAGTIPFEMETLTKEQQLNEYIMTSLRTIEGCKLDVVSKRFGEKESARIATLSHQLKETGLIWFEKNTLFLTKEGKWYADGIAAKLFCDS